MTARLAAWLVWALLAGSIVFWALRVFVQGSAVPPHAVPVTLDQAARGDPQRLFATAAPVQAAAPVPDMSGRFKLLGVMAPRASQGQAAPAKPRSGGLAVIAVDGKPARAIAVGRPVEGDWVLQAVTARSASIGLPGGATVATLEMPTLPTAATGTLPQATNSYGSAPPSPNAMRNPALMNATEPVVAPPGVTASPPMHKGGAQALPDDVVEQASAAVRAAAGEGAAQMTAPPNLQR
jgi:general secretion pathway protein C